MPDKIYPRDGPMWSRRIFININGRNVYSILTGENMNKVVVHKLLLGGGPGNLISKGRLRFTKTTDQGNPATALMFLPNKQEYPNQDPMILQISMLA